MLRAQNAYGYTDLVSRGELTTVSQPITSVLIQHTYLVFVCMYRTKTDY